MTEVDRRLRVHANGDASLRLTARERQVLYLVSQGQSNVMIGHWLGVTEDTVKTHVRHMMRKLDAQARAHLVRRGFELDLLQLEVAMQDDKLVSRKATTGSIRRALTVLGWTPPPRETNVEDVT